MEENPWGQPTGQGRLQVPSPENGTRIRIQRHRGIQERRNVLERHASAHPQGLLERPNNVRVHRTTKGRNCGRLRRQDLGLHKTKCSVTKLS